MADTFDKSSKLEIANEDLEQAKFKKTSAERIAVRVSNEDTDPIFVSQTEAGSYFSLEGNTSSLAGGATTNIINYTVPAGKKLVLSIAQVSGKNRAKYRVIKNGLVVGIKRTYYTEFNADFLISSAEITAGQTVQVEVTNNGLTSTDFDAVIQGRLLDE